MPKATRKGVLAADEDSDEGQVPRRAHEGVEVDEEVEEVTVCLAPFLVSAQDTTVAAVRTRLKVPAEISESSADQDETKSTASIRPGISFA